MVDSYEDRRRWRLREIEDELEKVDGITAEGLRLLIDYARDLQERVEELEKAEYERMIRRTTPRELQ